MEYTKDTKNIHPSSAAFILDDNNEKIFLIKRGTEPHRGMWMMPGGHIKIYETAEECLKREIHEETSLDIKIDRLFNVYSEIDQDPRHRALVIFYVAHVISGDFVQNIEAVEGKWFDIHDAPAEMAFHHRRILDDFINNYTF